VEVTGTDNPQNLGNGVTVWTTTWDEWLKDSATGPVTTSVPGSATAPTVPADPSVPSTDGATTLDQPSSPSAQPSSTASDPSSPQPQALGQ